MSTPSALALIEEITGMLMANLDNRDRGLEFQTELLNKLADLRVCHEALIVGQNGIIERLTRINGSIATLYTRSEENKEAIMAHPNICPHKERIDRIERDLQLGSHPGSKEVRGRVEELEKNATSRESERKTSEKWFNGLLKPFIWILLSAIATLLLSHAHDLLKR